MKVIVFPKDPNPYQDLLYGELGQQVDFTYLTPHVRSVFGLIPLVPAVALRLLFLRLKGYRILHIHFVYPFYIPKGVPFYKWFSYLYLSAFYWAVALLRFKVVWTVHNVIPQETFSINDVKLMQKLSRLADAKIAHAASVIDEMKSHGMSTDNVSIIPIGSYASVYPDTISESSARQKLGISPDEFVILFFAIVSPYKGTEDLIEAFVDLKLPNTRLLIVGKCADEVLRQRLEQAAAQHPKIDFYEGFVADADVATYFNASNIVCLPFRKITTSSSIMLALAFGKPVVTPLLGALRDLPQNVGYFYDPSLPDALKSTLLQAATHRSALPEKGRHGKQYSNSLSWDKIAAKTLVVYEGLSKKS